MTRRNKILVGLAVAGLLASAGCGAARVPSAAPGGGATAACPEANGPVTLRMQTWVKGVKEAAAIWNSENPNITVQVEDVPSGAPAYQKYTTELTANNAPDLAQIEYLRIPQFLTTQSLADISGCPGIDAAKSNFPKFTLDMVSLGQPGLYAVPQDTGPVALYYNKKVFAEAGIAVPATWADYATAAKTLAEKKPGSVIVAYPSSQIESLYQQAGAQPVTYSADGKLTIGWDTDPAIKKVNDYWQRLLDAKLVDTKNAAFSPDFFKGLGDGSIATWPCASWCAATIENNAAGSSGDWAVAPLPTWEPGKAASGNWGGSTTAVFSSSAHPAEAAKFALWLNTDPRAFTIMAQQSALYPAATSLADLPVLSAPDPFYGGQAPLTMFKAISATVPIGYAFSPAESKTSDTITDANAGIFAGTTTINASMAGVQQATLQYLQQLNIPAVAK